MNLLWPGQIALRIAFPIGLWSCYALLPAQAQPAPDNSTPAQNQASAMYVVDQFNLVYGPKGSAPHPGLPPLEELQKLKVDLSQSNDLVLAPGQGAALTTDLAHLSAPLRLSAGAMVAIDKALVAELNRRGYSGVWVSPSSEDIHPRTGEDLREGRKDLTLVIYTAEVKELRTIAKGTRIPPEKAVNNPAHERIAANSPLQPAGPEGRGSLLSRTALEDYVGRLNRFPGRTVEASVSSAGQPGGVVLDYLVSEAKPWVAYAQVANTGTSVSGDWRERFGFIDQQLSGRDDILSLDYVTADFQHSHAFFGSYEIPLLFPDRLKAKVYGSYAQFTADELGISSENIRGDSALAGLELSCTPLTFHGFDLGRLSFSTFFLDAILGARWSGVQVENQTFGSENGTDLVLPYAALNLSSVSQKARFAAGVQVEGNLADVAGTDQSQLAGLGRLDTDKEWVLAKWGLGVSFFLDPLISSSSTQLLHEVSFSSHGQYTFNNRRLIPQEEELIGGAYSVRGYPEALDAGDTVFVGTAEYRFYLARALRIVPQGTVSVGSKTSWRDQFSNPFRFRAKDVYGRSNWDLILRAFFDGGETFNNARRPTETDRTLLSTGVGVELQVRRNLNLRLDYGFVLHSETENLAEQAHYGDGRVHFSATLAW